MDQEVALKLFEEGATLFFLDVPIGTEFGIDFNSWNTGEKFKGSVYFCKFVDILICLSAYNFELE